MPTKQAHIHTFISEVPKSNKTCIRCGLKKRQDKDGKYYEDTAGNRYTFENMPYYKS